MKYSMCAKEGSSQTKMNKKYVQCENFDFKKSGNEQTECVYRTSLSLMWVLVQLRTAQPAGLQQVRYSLY